MKLNLKSNSIGIGIYIHSTKFLVYLFQTTIEESYVKKSHKTGLHLEQKMQSWLLK